jgi:Na+-translocating ferredoxin:NAD+ oxidoreductase RNF subunit RnfB
MARFCGTDIRASDKLMVLVTPIATIAGLTLVLASLLVLANHWLHVAEDPRIDDVEVMLPRTNCGGCGYPGCRPFAEALLAGDVSPGKCTVGAPGDLERIAAYLGVAVGAEEKRVARLACAGGSNVSRNHAHYEGWTTCAAAAVVAGGGKGCFWGCLGHGDCEDSCTFDAIEMNEFRLPVVDEQRCTACGDCVDACPKDLFSLEPQSHRLWVACRSLESGDAMLEDCQVACTACERCAMDAPNLIHMSQNLPVIDYSKGPATAAATQSCPTGAIVWLDEKLGPVKGQAARKIVRRGPVHDAPT